MLGVAAVGSVSNAWGEKYGFSPIFETKVLHAKPYVTVGWFNCEGVWKSEKPESGIGTGIGTGTGEGTGMGRKTYIKTGTTFTLI